MIKVRYPAERVERRVSLLRSPRKLFHLPLDGKFMVSSDLGRRAREGHCHLEYRRMELVTNFVSCNCLYEEQFHHKFIYCVRRDKDGVEHHGRLLKYFSGASYARRGKYKENPTWEAFEIDQRADFEKTLSDIRMPHRFTKHLS